MAAITLPDIVLNNNSYIDIYSMTGIAVGTTLLVQNKSSTGFYLQLKESQPSPTNIDGSVLQPYEFLLIKTTAPVKLWVRGSGRLSVQIDD